MQYQLVRSKRKSISLQVVAGEVLVRAPLLTPLSFIQTLLSNKAAWIDNKVNQQLAAKVTQNQLNENGQLWFQGTCYPLVVCYGNKSSVTINENSIVINVRKRATQYENSLGTLATPNTTSPERIKKALSLWLKQQAEAYLVTRTHYYSQQMKLVPTSINIRQYKARWGSCNNLGQIQLNYLLMMAPNWVSDYVIVHELCHLTHLNHSKQFWLLVEQHYPNFRLAKQWLKEHQQQLVWRI